MRSLLRLVLFTLVALGLGLGSVAHARETVNCADVSVASNSLAFDYEQGHGQKQGTADKGCLRCMAGCHGHHMATPATAEPVLEVYVLTPAPPVWLPVHMGGTKSDPTLRPPQA
ncbi:hypothetical protein [Sphingomonas sp. Ant20]|jgi:hypothetical protein|uniref:hypothetical protein n=1 Tax=Sphingomonas sp. Ant20 TaxID=104605 RepID=UPI000FE13DF9|nr:hypothetical protein [Sphingomonas sp. Ant20]